MITSDQLVEQIIGKITLFLLLPLRLRFYREGSCLGNGKWEMENVSAVTLHI